jgi:hypothetical protein
VKRLIPLLLLVALSMSDWAGAHAAPFATRGYYLTFMRMPTFGLDAWKKTVDAFHDDGANTLILWMAGGFRSRKFPETWQYNRDHANIRHDFARKLIDYAHTKGIRVLLGFTPFGYDGVNKMGEAHPEWRAIGPDGKTTLRFGIHCWGYNLCPAREDTQRFMREYVCEMAFDFYLNADGLFIESSDYAVCHCPNCGPRFFDNEFRFVKAISQEVWNRKPGATIAVYPHYFTGAKVPGLNVTAAKQEFDPRWTVVFTPHSANPDSSLIATAAGSIWSDDSPALRTPAAIRDNARKAAALGCTGYVPSLESFSYIPTEPEEGRSYLVGDRRVPFGFGWLREGETPYRELPIRINRIAYHEYGLNPALPDEQFRAVLGRELFEVEDLQAVDDALTLQEACTAERSWWQSAPLLSPDRLRDMRDSGTLTAQKKAGYRAMLGRVRGIEERYADCGQAYAELARTAKWIDNLWTGKNRRMLEETK